MTDESLQSHVLAVDVAASLSALLQRYGMSVEFVDRRSDIPGSFWGDSEAGLIGNTLYLRTDTPLHSALHESGHFLCMTPERRAALDTNAGGDELEECAVCYLQIVLADCIPGAGKEKIMRDMDDWGYSFRLASASLWFRNDAEDAREWLLKRGILNADGSPTYHLRKDV